MADSTRPLAAVASRIVSDLAYLVQTEIRLARAELSEKLGRAANGGMLIGIGAVVLLPGIFVLLLDAARWLAVAGIPEEWGLLLVGAAAVILGAGLAVIGANNIKPSALTPEQTIKQVRADISVGKEHV